MGNNQFLYKEGFKMVLNPYMIDGVRKIDKEEKVILLSPIDYAFETFQRSPYLTIYRHLFELSALGEISWKTAFSISKYIAIAEVHHKIDESTKVTLNNIGL